jgi:hypothetical protein
MGQNQKIAREKNLQSQNRKKTWRAWLNIDTLFEEGEVIYALLRVACK